MRPFRLLAVSAVLFTGVVGVPAVSETQVFANPQAQVSVDDSLWASVQGDSYTASPATLWEHSFNLRYNVQSGTVMGPSAQITLPSGLSNVWSWSGSGSSVPIHINWTGTTLTGTWPGIPAGGTTLEAGAIQPYTVGAPPVSISRTIPSPVFAGDSETRTVTLDVKVESALGAFNWFNANLVNSWDIPQGMAYAIVGTPTLPLGFSAGPEPGSYYCPTPGTMLEVGKTYKFAANVQFNRSGELAQAAMGNLYYKPESGVNYGVSTNVAPVNGGTSIAITTPSGVAATFSSLTPTNFIGNTNMVNGLALGAVVAAGSGQATPSQIWVSRLKETSISGTILHSVNVEVMGTNIIEGTITSPGLLGAVYGLQYDTDNKSWWLEFGSTDEDALVGFTAGIYKLALKGSDGVTRDFTILGPNEDVPADMPQFTQEMGFDTTEKRPTIGWVASMDGDVTNNYMRISSDKDGAYEFEGMFEKTVLFHEQPKDLDPGAWYVMVAYSKHTDGFTDEGVPLAIDFATVTDAYFNVTPEPATLALLAAGACALRVLRRRR